MQAGSGRLQHLGAERRLSSIAQNGGDGEGRQHAVAGAGGDKVRGVDMSSEITDDALHFFVSYNHFVYTPYYDTTMDELKIKQGEANEG